MKKLESKKVIEKKEVKAIEINDNFNDTFKVETQNTLPKYLYLKLLEEVSEYIKKECVNINSKIYIFVKS